jgi:phosphoribosylanthranilate isomerase
MQLKVSSITSLNDARYFSAIGANYLGFCFDALNPNNISIEKAREITSWLHDPVVVGEFGLHQTKEEIEFIAQQMDISEIQISFHHPQKNDLKFPKFLFVDDWKRIENHISEDVLIVKITQDEVFNSDLKKIISHRNIFIAADFSKENIREVKEQLHPFGIQLTCKREEKPGISYVDEYAEILELAGF